MTAGYGERLLIAIDGTAGAGKTTIGQILATKLGMPYLDTGAMYRAVTLLALRQGAGPENVEQLVEIAHNLNFKWRDATPEESRDGRQYTVLLGNEDVSQLIRTPEVEKMVSPISAVPQVRAEIVGQQQEIARRAGSMIMIGRDIGSVVLPEADLKIYLDASPEVRAQRRNQQEAHHEGDVPQSDEQKKRELEARDRFDSSRAASPLKVAPGAVVINTDYLSKEQVVEKILEKLPASARVKD